MAPLLCSQPTMLSFPPWVPEARETLGSEPVPRSGQDNSLPPGSFSWGDIIPLGWERPLPLSEDPADAPDPSPSPWPPRVLYSSFLLLFSSGSQLPPHLQCQPSMVRRWAGGCQASFSFPCPPSVWGGGGREGTGQEMHFYLIRPDR